MAPLYGGAAPQVKPAKIVLNFLFHRPIMEKRSPLIISGYFRI